MIWKYLERTSNLATVAAFAIAVYALLYPASVSDFLEEISESNARLADEIPYWLNIGDSSNRDILARLTDETGGAAFALTLENRGNFTISDIKVRVFDPSGNRLAERTGIFLSPFGEYVVYDVAPSGSFQDGMTTCISGYSTRAEKLLYEKRVMAAEGVAGLNSNFTTDYVFTDIGWPQGCDGQ